MANAMVIARSGISASRRSSVIRCGGCSGGNSSPCFGFRRLVLIVSSPPGLVRYKKRRIDEISQFTKRPQGDSRDVANLEQGRIRPGHPLRDMHLCSVRMPDDHHPLPIRLSTPKASHAATRQRVVAVINPHPIMITGSV